MSFRIHYANTYIQSLLVHNFRSIVENINADKFVSKQHNEHNEHSATAFSFDALNLKDMVAKNLTVTDVTLREVKSAKCLGTDSSGKIISIDRDVSSKETTHASFSSPATTLFLGLSCRTTKSASVSGSQIQTNALIDSGFNVEFDSHGFIQLIQGRTYKIDYKCTLTVAAKTKMSVFIYSLNKDRLKDSTSQHDNFDSEAHSATFTGSAILKPSQDDGIALLCDPEFNGQVSGTIFVEIL